MTDLKFFDSNMFVGPDMEFNDSLRGNRRRIDGRMPGIDEALVNMRELNIYKALVRHVLSYQYNADYGNDRLIDEISGRPEFKPVFMVYPTAAMIEMIRKYKAGGVLLYTGAYRFKAGADCSNSEWSMGDVYEMLETIKMPVFARLNVDVKFDDVDRILSDHPNLRLVLRDVGLNVGRDLFSLARKHPDFYVDTTDYKAFFGIEDFAAKFGSERLIFGSGYPVQSIGGAVTPLLLSRMRDEEKENIAFRNMERLLEDIDYGY